MAPQAMYEFNRYVGGVLMAEGIGVHADDMADAVRKAMRLLVREPRTCLVHCNGNEATLLRASLSAANERAEKAERERDAAVREVGEMARKLGKAESALCRASTALRLSEEALCCAIGTHGNKCYDENCSSVALFTRARMSIKAALSSSPCPHAAIAERAEDTNPGMPVASGPCPSCGVTITLEYGDDEDEFMALTDKKEGLWKKEK